MYVDLEYVLDFIFVFFFLSSSGTDGAAAAAGRGDGCVPPSPSGSKAQGGRYSVSYHRPNLPKPLTQATNILLSLGNTLI